MLRARLKAMKLDGFLVPRADAHQNEYVAPCEERLAWLAGFTGSAGFVIALADKAALFVDGRYTIQAREQVDSRAFALVPLAEVAPADWLAKNARKGARIGYDPWLHTSGQVARFEAAAKKAGASLVAVDENPIDAIWSDRPAHPSGRVALHPPRHAGESAVKKLARVAASLKADALLVSDPHALAWAFNLRGADVAHTPIALGYALIPRKGKPRLFLEPEKLTARSKAALGRLALLSPPSALPDALKDLGAKKQKLLFDAGTAPSRLTSLFTEAGGEAQTGTDPIGLMKARKNAAELAGARAAHLRDGVAMARFLCWFDKTAPRGRLTEIAAAQALETFRREGGELRDISFPTISAARAHAALPHYRVTENPTPASARASIWSIPARNISTAPPTSPARSRSAAPARLCARQHARAQGPYRHRRERSFPREPAARSSTPSRVARSGRRASTSTTAPATASAPICRCTKGRSAFPSSAASRWSRA